MVVTPVGLLNSTITTNEFINTPNQISIRDFKFNSSQNTSSTITWQANRQGSVVDYIALNLRNAASNITIRDVDNVPTVFPVTIAPDTLNSLTFDFYTGVAGAYVNVSLNGQFIFSTTTSTRMYYNPMSVRFYTTVSTVLEVKGLGFSSDTQPATYTAFNSQASGNETGYYTGGEKIVATLPVLLPDTYYVQYQLSGSLGTSNWSSPLTVNIIPESVKLPNKYIFIRYSSGSSPSVLSTDPVGAIWIGFHNTTSQTPNSTVLSNPSSYIWYRLQSGVTATNKLWFRTTTGLRELSWILSASNPSVGVWTEASQFGTL